jgi:hypothetical protein
MQRISVNGIIKIFIFLFFIPTTFAQLKTPTQYFGHELGSKFHWHHQMVEYANYLVLNNSSKAKLIEYGKTYEGRKLFVIAISSIENISQLETIRQNNLKSIGLLEGTPSQKQPAIAWLSYNVHGNEPVSMEASMEVMYQLLNNKDGENDKVLSNSIIIVDPCINPDGRDRYANWYNQKVGVNSNSDPISIEHSEPWPVGRTNHYLFDLNRDWAWMVQDESKQRMALYNTWMPHLHADFHEQDINSPYYFAPAAKPYHEEMTGWQREFQQKIGQYNKKEFDKNGWLYFSNERFDLLYPSYGDTYPTFNGAIGMTYEQGGIRGGLSYVLNDGDTLTLKKRISHHVASSFAAINAIADNASKNVDEFIKYFEKSKNNTDIVYQTYIIKSKGSENKIAEFTNHMDMLGLKYGIAGKSIPSNGYSFLDRKTKSFNIDPNDLVLSMDQPKSRLLKVLMEPQTFVEDSITYDITAWSMAYAYGLNAFSLKEKIGSKPFEKIKINNIVDPTKTPFAYLIKWDSFSSVKLMADLLNKKIKVRRTELPIEIGGKSYERGTLIITRTGNEGFSNNLENIIFNIANKYNVTVDKSFTGMVTKGFDLGSENVPVLKNPRIALIGGEPTSTSSFGEIWHFFDKQINFPITMVNSDYLNSNNFSKFDVIIIPGGAFNRVIFDNTLKSLQDWVKLGGKLIIMENANNSFSDKVGFDLKKKDVKKDTTLNNHLYENRERVEISDDTPGSIYALNMDNTHPLALGYDKTYYSLVLNASDFSPLKNGWNVGTINDNSIVAGFVGKKAKEKLKNTLAFGVEEIGRGKVVYMIHNPLFRGFWQNGKMLFANAVFGF